jgi:acetylornithine deacetylase
MKSRSLEILKRLIAFDTTSRESNLALIRYVDGLLTAHGVECTWVYDTDRKKANLFASVGPADQAGVLLSGHTDVVPVDGQNWTFPAFQATERDGNLYGRGTCDMKGFIACALNLMLEATQTPLHRPLQLALSYDEEIGCVGVRSLLDYLKAAPIRPMLCVVGEPTQMQMALGHKGKTSLRAHCHGQEAHSSLAPLAANAVHLACDFVSELRSTQARLQEEGARDPDFDVPYSTVHVGNIQGGTALNIVPNHCSLEFEIRNLGADAVAPMIDHLHQAAEEIAQRFRPLFAQSRIDLEEINSYPGLDTLPTVEAVRFFHALTRPGTRQTKVAFGTEGGLFAQHLDTPVVVCGPGSIEQAHKPDEYVSIEQLSACDELLARLLAALTAR